MAEQSPELIPFQWLAPQEVPSILGADISAGLDDLEFFVGAHVQVLVRALVNYTLAWDQAVARQQGRQPAVGVEVLNRRRRVARSWLLAILGGKVQRETLEDLQGQWLPQLRAQLRTTAAGDAGQSAIPCRNLVEFLRGAISALIMEQPADNLLPQAKALYSLETILAIHLQVAQASQEAAQAVSVPADKLCLH